MSNARNLADLLDSTGDVKSDALDNVSGLPEAIDVNASAPADSLNIDASGNVGIGTNSPTALSNYTSVVANNSTGSMFELMVGGTRTANIQTSASAMNIQTRTNIPIIFDTNSTECMRITSDGRGLSQFTAKAWIRFHMGQNSITDSHNISSISSPESGQTIVNFSNSPANTNYCAVASSDQFYGGNTGVMDYYSGSFRVVNSNSSAYTPTDKVCVVVFGD